MRAQVGRLGTRLLIAGLVVLAACVLGRDLVPAAGPGRIVRRFLGHPPLVAAMLALPAAVMLARAGRRGQAAAVAGLAALGAAGYVLYRIEVRFPDHQLFSISGYQRAARVLLGRDLLVSEFRPRPALVVPNRTVLRARYPVIDIHFHLGSLEGVSPQRLVTALDSVGVVAAVNLDGWRGQLEAYVERFARPYPGRFIMFVMPDLGQVSNAAFAPNQLAWMERAAHLGARGVKIWKFLGLTLRDEAGRVVPIDDPRFDPIWERAAELGFPVLMHVGDPRPFFEPIDRFNERFVELIEHPDWSFHGPAFPPRDSILRQRERLLARHPRTVFIGAHFGDNADDLREAGRLLDRYPNYYLEISSKLNELARQPRTAREFIIRYQDRVLFGTDGGYALGRGRWSPEQFYRRYFELLETANEYVDYPLADITRQGDWKVYGLDLPDSVLRKLYYENARRLLPSDEHVQRVLARLDSVGRVALDGACARAGPWWARRGRDTLSGPDLGTGAYGGDSVWLAGYSFRPGRDREIVANGFIRNGSRSTVELRGYRVEYLTRAGAVAGVRTCRVRMGQEHCGLASTSVLRPGHVALSADTIRAAPDGARADTARIFWSYCKR